MSTSSSTHGYAQRIDIRAGIDRVWRALIEPQQLAVWCAARAKIDPRVGGRYHIHTDAGLDRDAHIDVFEPLRRLRLIYQSPRELPADECVIVDDFLLHELPHSGPGPKPVVTVLRLLGSGFPEKPGWNQYYLRVRGGWERTLVRLKVTLEKSQSGATAATATVPVLTVPPATPAARLDSVKTASAKTARPPPRRT